MLNPYLSHRRPDRYDRQYNLPEAADCGVSAAVSRPFWDLPSFGGGTLTASRFPQKVLLYALAHGIDNNFHSQDGGNRSIGILFHIVATSAMAGEAIVNVIP